MGMTINDDDRPLSEILDKDDPEYDLWNDGEEPDEDDDDLDTTSDEGV